MPSLWSKTCLPLRDDHALSPRPPLVRPFSQSARGTALPMGGHLEPISALTSQYGPVPQGISVMGGWW